MKITYFNFLGRFRNRTDSGVPVTYQVGDVVMDEGKTYIATNTVRGYSPKLGEKVGWTILSDRQVLYETENEPFHSNVGDEWLNKTTGVFYKKIENEGNHFWVEL